LRLSRPEKYHASKNLKKAKFSYLTGQGLVLICRERKWALPHSIKKRRINGQTGEKW
jgi:hypothetical protein